MKYLTIVMMVTSSLLANIVTDKDYTCGEMPLHIMDGGASALIGNTILFNTKGSIYTGVTPNNAKAYMVVYSSLNKISIGFSDSRAVTFDCIEVNATKASK